jgi:hypothetical protein
MGENYTITELQMNSYLEQPWLRKIWNKILLYYFKYPPLTAGLTEETSGNELSEISSEILETINYCDKRRLDWNEMVKQSFEKYCIMNPSQKIDGKKYENALYFYLRNNQMNEKQSEIGIDYQTADLMTFVFEQ